MNFEGKFRADSMDAVFAWKVASFIDNCNPEDVFDKEVPVEFDYSRLKRHENLLSRAVVGGKRGMVKWLLSKGADPNDKTGCTLRQSPLHRYAATIKQDDTAKDDTAIPEMLLDSGADVDDVSKNGQTALHQCVAGGLLKVARLLIERGATVDVKDTAGRTPLDYVHFCSMFGNNNEREMTCLLMDSRIEQLFSRVIASGLASFETPLVDFLCKGVYDPRLLIHIANFAFVENVVNKRKF